ncbi:TetR/AcrR family transcriptional regulator [Jannaschia seohaensis]|uniref:Regulatory TetR family protein n=1 Tax=Jannaschia seohaensis TaxID=475081 RepID=A0A2Y9AQX0_9RHOB|nr:TetR/AcrR family transcriptional regulator [Jannaschia seohaensis]PWJ18325.1 regulatory TetR family protein [Jannaschia seohaensis]SSA46850.1 regulatory protein, tetR family [Jannaschia seohaensis]
MPRPPSFDREEIIARARDLFWRQGWAGTSMKDLERELGLKPGSFYAAFGSKDALFALTLERYAEAGEAALAAHAAALSPLEALKAHLRSFARPDRPARACMLVKTLLEGAGREAALAAKADALLDRMEARFATLFAEAQAAGEIAAHHDPARLARRYQADITGLRASAERSRVDAAELAEEMAADLDALR